MKTNILILIIGLALGICPEVAAQNQDYVATPVTISKDRVRRDGKVYYSHIVLEKQTLFSISKVYGVTLQEIYAANPALNLETAGLQTHQILLIPDHSTAVTEPESQADASPAPSKSESAQAEVSRPVTSSYRIHTVKWFEDLPSIARKYNVTVGAIMKANDLSSPEVSRKQKIKIPVPGMEEEGEEVEAAVEAEDGKTIVDTIEEAVTETLDDLFSHKRSEIEASLILPFNAAASPNENYLEFYSGVLLAVRDLEELGIHTTLNVYDAADGQIPLTSERLENCDIVLGPLAPADLSATLELCPVNTAVISPLDPKAADLARLHPNLIHAPAAAEVQCRELMAWLKQEMREGDSVVLLTEKGATHTSNSAALVKYLSESGIKYSTITYGILEGKDISATLEQYASENSTCRVILASESEAFVNDAVRNTNLLVHKKFPVALYCLSKVRNFETIEVENFHRTNMHVCISYFVDYESFNVQKFLMEYRALMNTEPGPFAYQGYDTAFYFIKSCAENGRRWTDRMDVETIRGLQSNFKFERTEAGGHINTAVRRVIYAPDYSVILTE